MPTFIHAFGGGLSGCVASNCMISANEATSGGGGSYDSTLNFCTLMGNSTSMFSGGGGCWGGTLNKCTLSDNSAISSGGGCAIASLNNCILTGNSALDGGGSYGGVIHWTHHDPPGGNSHVGGWLKYRGRTYK